MGGEADLISFVHFASDSGLRELLAGRFLEEGGGKRTKGSVFSIIWTPADILIMGDLDAIEDWEVVVENCNARCAVVGGGWGDARFGMRVWGFNYCTSLMTFLPLSATTISWVLNFHKLLIIIVGNPLR